MKKNIILLCFITTISILAQEQSNQTWDLTFHFSSGYSLSTSDWEYTHPYILGSGGSFTGRISGTYEESYNFELGLEISKGYFGFQINTGWFPAKFSIKKQVDPGITQVRNDNYSFNSIFLEAEGILFPLGNSSDKIVPLIKIGLSGMRTIGDIKNNLLSFSGSIGTKIFITPNLGAYFSLKYRYMLLFDVRLTNEISAAYGVSLSALSTNIGIFYRL